MIDYNKLCKQKEHADFDMLRMSGMQKYAYDSVLERLGELDLNCTSILDVGSNYGYLPKLLEQKYLGSLCVSSEYSYKLASGLRKNAGINTIAVLNPENLPFESKSFDLVTFSCGLHFVNHPLRFLQESFRVLNTNGVLIGNFFGGGSLKNLRRFLIEHEDMAKQPHFQRLVPLITFQDTAPLLQKCGFEEVIVDFEEIELEAENIIFFMKKLKKSGNGNCLEWKSCYTIYKQMYNLIQKNNDLFFDKVILINFIASKNKRNIIVKKIG